MADNTELNLGSGGDVIATDDIGGVKYQIVKMTYGALDAQTIASSGTGIDNAGTQRVTLATDIALPAGTNAIGKLAANSGVDIGDVDVLSLPASTNTIEVVGDVAENAAAAGNPLLSGGRFDSSARTLGNGDVGAIALNASGHVICDVSATVGGTHTDDAAFTPATDDGVPMFGMFDDTAPDSVDEGDAGIVRMSANRNLYSTIRDAAGNERGMNVDANGDIGITIEADNVGIGGGTQYTEDDVAAANPVGNAQILVRDDAPVSVAADGDNVALRGTQYGAAYTQIVDSSGNFIDSFGGSGGTAAADDADFVAGTTQGTPAMGVFESSPTSVTDGDLGTVGITVTRSLKVEETNSTAILADTANMDTNLGTLAGAVTGTEMQVDLVSANVTNAGTFVIQEDGAALTALQLIDNPIVAHDAAASGATGVSMAGGRATASVEGNTEVAAADASYIATDLSGVQITRAACAPEELVSFYVANTDGAEDAVTGLDAGGAGIHNYITSVTISNNHASTHATVRLLAGSGGAVWWEFPAPAVGGATMNFDPPLKQPTANQALYVDPSAAVSTIGISIQGYQGQG